MKDGEKREWKAIAYGPWHVNSVGPRCDLHLPPLHSPVPFTSTSNIFALFSK